MMKKEEIIKTVRKSFDTAFTEKKYYEKQTKDDTQLNKILNSLIINKNSKVLDLGTGGGYLAFEIARRHKECEVVGLDIVVNTLESNNNIVKEQQISNLSFINYDGISFPFSDNSFDCIVTRYALHHFPDIKNTFSEIKRVLKPGGQLFISDPTPNEDDKTRFIDIFMQLQKDGHVQFYSKEEYKALAENVGLQIENDFITEIRFPSSSRTEGFREIEPNIDKTIIDSYKIEIVNNEVYITEKVLNISFKNKLS